MKIDLSNITLFIKKKKINFLIFILILLVSFFVILIFSVSNVRKTTKIIRTSIENGTPNTLNWENQEIELLAKEKLWFENQYSLSKDDSISLGINLRDSLVQIQFKGVSLIQSKIRFIKPAKFLSKIDANTYANLFGRAFKLVDEKANFAKKPIKKMKVVTGAEAIALENNDSIKPSPFYWEFVTDNDLRIVLYGLKSEHDSIVKTPSFIKERIKFELKRKSKDPENQNYHPTLFIWLNDKDAKAIYRSLPENPKLIFLN